MGKFLVRLTIISVAIYLVIAYLIAQFIGVDILTNTYTLMFELCVVVFTFSDGRYHCKYIRYLMLAIFLSDTLAHSDYLFNFMSVTAHNLISIALLVIGAFISLFQAISHFIKVRKIKRNNEK